MNAMIHRLPELLVRLDELWAGQGAPISHYAAPGLSDREIDRLTKSAGILVPPELRLWWGWHNGVMDHGPDEWCADNMGPFLKLNSLELSLELRASHLSDGRPDPSDPVIGEWYWRESWLPVSGTGNRLLYVDCDVVTSGDLTPVYRSDVMWEKGWEVPVATSFTAAVATIVRVIEEGYFGWSEAEDAWMELNTDLPRDIDWRFF